jgi:hypothetical protein
MAAPVVALATLAGIQGALAGLQASVGALQAAATEISKGIKMYTESSQKSLAISQAVNDTFQKGTDATKGLSLSLDRRFSIGLELQRNAIIGNTQGIGKLAAAQEALGISSKETINTFAQVASVGLMTNQGLNNLAETTLKTGLKYSMSTEELVKSLEALRPAFETLNIAGVDSENFAKATQEFIGQIGFANKALAENFIKILMDPSEANRQRLLMAGMLDEHRALLSGELNASEMLNSFKSALEDSKESMDTFRRSTSESVEFIQDTFGRDLAILPTVLLKSLDQKKTVQDANERFAQIMSNIGNTMKAVFAPVEKIRLDFMEKFQDVIPPIMEAISLLTQAFLNPIMEAFGDFHEGLLGSGQGINKFKDYVIDTLVPIAIRVGRSFVLLMEVLTPLIKGIFSTMSFFANILNYVGDLFTDNTKLDKEKLENDRMIKAFQDALKPVEKNTKVVADDVENKGIDYSNRSNFDFQLLQDAIDVYLGFKSGGSINLNNGQIISYLKDISEHGAKTAYHTTDLNKKLQGPTFEVAV